MASTNNYDLQFISFDKLRDETPTFTTNATYDDVGENISKLINLSAYFVGYKINENPSDINYECRFNASTTLGYVLSSLYAHIDQYKDIGNVDELIQNTQMPNNIKTGTTIGYLDEGTDISGWSVASVLTAILCKVTPDIIMPTCRINSKAYIHYIEDGDLDISTLSDFYGIYKEGKVTPVYGNRPTANYSGGIESAYFKHNNNTINVTDYTSPSAGDEVNIYPMSDSKITLTPGNNNITFYVKYKAGKDIYKMTGDIYRSAPAATISGTLGSFNQINGTYKIYTKHGNTYKIQPKTKYKDMIELELDPHNGYDNIKAGFAIHESLKIKDIKRWSDGFKSWQSVPYEYTKATNKYNDHYDVYECNIPGNMESCKLQITFK